MDRIGSGISNSVRWLETIFGGTSTNEQPLHEASNDVIIEITPTLNEVVDTLMKAVKEDNLLEVNKCLDFLYGKPLDDSFVDWAIENNQVKTLRFLVEKQEFKVTLQGMNKMVSAMLRCSSDSRELHSLIKSLNAFMFSK